MNPLEYAWKFVKLFIKNIFTCCHFASDLTVISKDTLLEVSKDGQFEHWSCTCKCKCGKTVQHDFSNTTDKFWAPIRELERKAIERQKKFAREQAEFWKEQGKPEYEAQHRSDLKELETLHPCSSVE